VDARNGEVLDSVRQSGRGIAFGAGSIWIADEVGDAVVMFDPLSRQVVTRIELAPGSAPVAVAATPAVVWVAAKGSSTVERIDPVQRVATGGSTAVTGGPTDIAAAGSIWVASGPTDAVVRIDPSDGRVAQTYTAVCDEPGGLAVLGQEAWVACRRDGTVLRIGTAGVVTTAEFGFVPNDVALDGETVWVTLAAE
jgi:streptogramin lyase